MMTHTRIGILHLMTGTFTILVIDWQTFSRKVKYRLT